MRRGIIDMGTNTFHLLIAEKKKKGFKILHQEKQAVRIGKGGISVNKITQDAISRAIDTLKQFKTTLDEFGIIEPIVTATSAVRNASNQQAFIAEIKCNTGLEVRVLSGREEATLIYHGVQEFVALRDETALIMDIGGGSIEFILADHNKIKWLKSYELGGQRLIDQFHHSDPISHTEQSQLIAFLDEQLEDLFDACRNHDAKYLIGSSGSFDTFWDIYSEQTGQKSENPKLNLNSFDEICRELITKNRDERLAIPGMIPMRVDMIVGASIVTRLLLERCQMKMIEISLFALKEGLLYHGLPKAKID